MSKRMIRLRVPLDPELQRRVEEHAVQTGRTIVEVGREALREYIKEFEERDSCKTVKEIHDEWRRSGKPILRSNSSAV